MVIGVLKTVLVLAAMVRQIIIRKYAILIIANVMHNLKHQDRITAEKVL